MFTVPNLVLLILLPSTICSSLNECKRNNDCNLMELCAATFCVNRNMLLLGKDILMNGTHGKECNNDTECEENQICIDSECMPHSIKTLFQRKGCKRHEDCSCRMFCYHEFCISQDFIGFDPNKLPNYTDKGYQNESTGCNTSRDCPKKEKCLNGGCWPTGFAKLADDSECKNEKDCSSFRCNTENDMMDDKIENSTDLYKAECKVNSDCNLTELCLASYCFNEEMLLRGKNMLMNGTHGNECKNNTACEDDQICINSECLPQSIKTLFHITGCKHDNECEKDTFCHNEFCISIDFKDFDLKKLRNNTDQNESLFTGCVTTRDCWKNEKCLNGGCWPASFAKLARDESDIPECTFNEDCDEGKVCAATFCLNRKTLMKGKDLLMNGTKGKACNVDNECDEGQVCLMNECLPHSIKTLFDRKKCTTNDDCANDTSCINSVCIANGFVQVGLQLLPTRSEDNETTSGCASNSDCSNNEECYNNGCWPTGFAKLADDSECTVNADCLPNNKCINGSCQLTSNTDEDLFKPECMVNGECAEGELCVASFCMSRAELSHAKDLYLADKPRKDCNDSDGCSSEEICVENNCLSNTIVTLFNNTGCTSTSDCQEGTFCINSFCVENSFQAAGQVILENSNQFNNSEATCMTNDECADSDKCLNGGCWPNAIENIISEIKATIVSSNTVCMNNSECEMFEKCVNNRCYSKMTIDYTENRKLGCKHHSDCYDRELCVASFCMNKKMLVKGQKLLLDGNQTSCVDNEQCTSEELCIDHKCTPKMISSLFQRKECKKQDECMKNELCISSFCVPYELVSVGEKILPDGFDISEQSDAEGCPTKPCSEDETCMRGQCWPKSFAKLAEKISEPCFGECSQQEFCLHSKCVYVKPAQGPVEIRDYIYEEDESASSNTIITTTNCAADIWTYWSGAEYCVGQRAEQIGAALMCNLAGAELISIKNNDEMAFVNKLFGEEAQDYWIGLIYGNSSWRNVDNTPVTYFNFYHGQPLVDARAICVSANKEGVDGYWFATHCDELHYHVCKRTVDAGDLEGKMEPNRPKEQVRLPTRDGPCPLGWNYRNETNACYFVGRGSFTFYEAKEMCQLNGTDLTSIASPQEAKYISSLTGGKSYLIGLMLTSAKQLKWLDGSRSRYLPFGPQSYDSNKDNCVVVYVNEAIVWKLVPCDTVFTNPQYYVCRLLL